MVICFALSSKYVSLKEHFFVHFGNLGFFKKDIDKEIKGQLRQRIPQCKLSIKIIHTIYNKFDYSIVAQ
jgi:hypothetical protein